MHSHLSSKHLKPKLARKRIEEFQGISVEILEEENHID